MAGEKKNKDKRDEPSSEYKNFQQLLDRVLSVPKEKVAKKRAKQNKGKGDG